MLADGSEPYPIGFKRTHTLAEVRSRYADLLTDTASGDIVVGRRAGHLHPQHRQALLRHPASRRRHRTAGDALARQGRRGDADALEAAGRPRRPASGSRGEVISSRARRAVGAGRRVGDDREGACVPCRSHIEPTERGGAGPAALRRPDRAAEAARKVVRTRARGGAQPARHCSTARDFIEVETPMLQTAARGRHGSPVRDAHATLSISICICVSRRSCSSSGRSSAESTGSSRSTGTSATRASTRRTAPSSRCSRSTRRTATTTRWRR